VTAQPRSDEFVGREVTPADVFRLRCWARAYLSKAGELTRIEAVDALQEWWLGDRLVDEIGQSGVQEILSDEFAKVSA
jgi:hypothetical protein